MVSLDPTYIKHNRYANSKEESQPTMLQLSKQLSSKNFSGISATSKSQRGARGDLRSTLPLSFSTLPHLSRHAEYPREFRNPHPIPNRSRSAIIRKRPPGNESTPTPHPCTKSRQRKQEKKTKKTLESQHQGGTGGE